MAGIAIAAGSLAPLLVAANKRPFRCMESGYRPAIGLTIAAEAAAIVAQGAFAVMTACAMRAKHRERLE